MVGAEISITAVYIILETMIKPLMDNWTSLFEQQLDTFRWVPASRYKWACLRKKVRYPQTIQNGILKSNNLMVYWEEEGHKELPTSKWSRDYLTSKSRITISRGRLSIIESKYFHIAIERSPYEYTPSFSRKFAIGAGTKIYLKIA